MSVKAGSTRLCCSPRQRESLAARYRGTQHMLGATGEVCVGLNRGRFPPGSRWRIPDPGRSHGRHHGLEPGEGSSVLPSFQACPVASNDVAARFAADLDMLPGGRPWADDHSLALDPVFVSAERFITLFHSENRAGPADRRLRHVRRQIQATGTYRHTAADLEFGALVARLNSSRRIGRLYWRSLRVRDRRGVTAASAAPAPPPRRSTAGTCARRSGRATSATLAATTSCR